MLLVWKMHLMLQLCCFFTFTYRCRMWWSRIKHDKWVTNLKQLYETETLMDMTMLLSQGPIKGGLVTGCTVPNPNLPFNCSLWHHLKSIFKIIHHTNNTSTNRIVLRNNFHRVLCSDTQSSQPKLIAAMVRRNNNHISYRATPPGSDTVKGYKYRFFFLLFPTTCLTSVSVFYNHLLCCCVF